MKYSTRHISSLFNISPPTIHEWCKLYEPHFSIHATPPKGKHRSYTEDDLGVFSLIKQLREENKSPEEIQAALSNGSRGAIPLVSTTELDQFSSDSQIQALKSELEEIRMVLAIAEQDRDKALAEVKPTRDHVIRLETELEIRKNTAEMQITNLNARIAEMEARLLKLSEEVGVWKGKYQEVSGQGDILPTPKGGGF